MLLTESLQVTSTITGQRFYGQLSRSYIDQEPLSVFALPITHARIWDAFQTNLTTAASDDLGIATGAFGTGLPTIRGLDLVNGTVTGYARWLFQMPANYVALGDVKIRFAAGMVLAAAATSATVDVEAYLSARTGLKTGSDLVTTSAISINSTTFAENLFSVTSNSLSPGSWLDIRATLSAASTAIAANTYAAIAHAEILCTTQG